MAAETLATSSTSGSLSGASEATEFGAALRDMRLAHNTDLATVASSLRIRQVYLQAIEDGRFNDLPGPTYAAGFVRAYAEYLGLDLSEVMRRYREVALGSDRQAPLVAPSPVVEGTLPTGFILLVAAVLAATAYGSWYYLTLNGRDMGDIVSQIPQQIAEVVGMNSSPAETSTTPVKPEATTEPAADAAQSDTGGQPAPIAAAEPSEVVVIQESTPDAVSPAPVEQERAPVRDADSSVAVSAERQPAPARAETEIVHGTAATPDEATVQSAGEGPPMTAGEGPSAQSDTIETTVLPPPDISVPVAAAPVPNADQTAVLPGSPVEAVAPEPASRVMLRATAISWVELRDASGKRVFSRLLKKGETYNVPGRDGITLATGNAGALDVLVDGQTIGPLGPVGAVRRDVLLEPDALIQRINNR